MSRFQEKGARFLLTLPPAAYLLLFFLLPGLMMLLASFRFPGDYGGLAPWYYLEEGSLTFDLTLENWARLFESTLYLQLLLKSLGCDSDRQISDHEGCSVAIHALLLMCSPCTPTTGFAAWHVLFA